MSKTNSENAPVRSPLKRTVLTKIKEKTNSKKFNNIFKRKMYLPAKIGLVVFLVLLSTITYLSIELINTNKEVDSAYRTIQVIAYQKTQLQKDKEELVKSNKVTKDALDASNEKVAELKTQLANKKVDSETVTKKVVENTTNVASKSGEVKSMSVVTENTKAKTTNTKKEETTTASAESSSSGYKTDEYGTYYERTMRITCYCSCARCCGKWAYNRPKDENGKDIIYTASGKRAVEKYTLGASTAYAFGTKIYVPGVGICEVMDRGSGVKSNTHLDMYFSSHQAALNFGNKKLTCKVYV